MPFPVAFVDGFPRHQALVAIPAPGGPVEPSTGYRGPQPIVWAHHTPNRHRFAPPKLDTTALVDMCPLNDLMREGSRFTFYVQRYDSPKV